MTPTSDMLFGTTPEDKVAMELPVDIEQLLDESEREALELLRTWSDATRARLRVRQPQPRDSRATAALKTLLDSGLLTQQEYEEKRAAVVAQL